MYLRDHLDSHPLPQDRAAVSYGSTPKRTVPPFGQSSATAGRGEVATAATIAMAAADATMAVAPPAQQIFMFI